MSARRLLGLAGGFDCLELELELGLARRDALAMLFRRDVYGRSLADSQGNPSARLFVHTYFAPGGASFTVEGLRSHTARVCS